MIYAQTPPSSRRTALRASEISISLPASSLSTLSHQRSHASACHRMTPLEACDERGVDVPIVPVRDSLHDDRDTDLETASTRTADSARSSGHGTVIPEEAVFAMDWCGGDQAQATESTGRAQRTSETSPVVSTYI